MTPDGTCALECRDVSVSYGDVAALVGVSAAFAPGLIHAVVGQNGAGKTTFARVAAGLVRPGTGVVRIAGRQVHAGSVQEARAAGVELVHQSFALPPSFTVAEAMEFGAQGKGRLYSRAGLEARWRPHLTDLGVTARPRDRVRDLPVESQQAVEIARALVTDARVLILDEPTAVLAPAGIETLFARVRTLKQRGVTVIVILHKIREVLAIADTVTVLRGGRLVAGPLPAAEIDAARLADLIVGAGAARDLPAADAEAAIGSADLRHAAPAAAPAAGHGPPMLSLEGVATRADAEGPALSDIDLEIGHGEILGIAGVEGNGQRTLVRTLSALVGLERGRIAIDGRDMSGATLAERRAAGFRVIPFERNSEGLSLSSSLWENWAVRQLVGQKALAFIRPERLRAACDTALRQWDVRYASNAQRAGSLSGGNAQKVILAREIDANAKLIVAAQPTRGLDVGATAFVWRALRQARAKGCGILLISSDLDEIFDISDRVAVMLSGRVVGIFTPPYELAAIGAAMTGARQ
jgi:general nucleoside transport system ATP-binding protein